MEKNLETLDIEQTSQTHSGIRGSVDTNDLDIKSLQVPNPRFQKFGHLEDKNMALQKPT